MGRWGRCGAFLHNVTGEAKASQKTTIQKKEPLRRRRSGYKYRKASKRRMKRGMLEEPAAVRTYPRTQTRNEICATYANWEQSQSPLKRTTTQFIPKYRIGRRKGVHLQPETSGKT